MKNYVCRLLAVLLIMCWGIVNIPITASAEVVENKDVYTQIADQKSNEYHSQKAPDIEEDNNISILDVYNKIYDLVYDENSDTFNELYGGAYMNDQGKLVVLYVGDSNKLLNLLKENSILLNENIIFDKVENSYNSLYEGKKRLKQTINGKSSLIDSLAYYYIDNKNNCIQVVLKSNTINTEERGISTHGKWMDLLEDSVDVDIAFDYKDIEIVEAVDTVGDEKREITNYNETTVNDRNTVSIYPGQVIFNDYVQDGKPFCSRFSVGMRGQYIGTDGIAYFGFITVSHGIKGGDSIYIKISGLNRIIGYCKWKYKDHTEGIDAAFIALKSGYEMTNTVYFDRAFEKNANSMAYEQVFSAALHGDQVYSNYYSHMPDNFPVYTNGAATGRTVGTITTFEGEIPIGNTAANCYAISNNPAFQCDSGGIVYSNATSNGTYDDYITVGNVVATSTGEDNVCVIMTYHRLRQVITQSQSSLGNITFLTIY